MAQLFVQGSTLKPLSNCFLAPRYVHCFFSIILFPCLPGFLLFLLVFSTFKLLGEGLAISLYIYIYIYIYAVKLFSGPSLAILKAIIWDMCFCCINKTIQIMGFNRSIKRGAVAQSHFKGYYMGQVGHFYVAPNLAQITTLTWAR